MTNEKSLLDGVRDEILRLMHLQKENLTVLGDSPELFDVAAKKQTIDIAKAKCFSGDLNNEMTKAKNLELVVAVVGTMKAGKSTTINAIVGTEVLPNRSEAMTTLPTAIRHTAGLVEPRLTFAMNAPFNNLITQLAGPFKSKLEKLSCPDEGAQVEGVPQDVQALADAFLSGEVSPLATQYVGRDAIYGFLHRLNDLVRLADLVKIPTSPLDSYTQIDHFPLIEVEFSHLKAIEGYGKGKFTLLDTPGPNEATRGKALRNVLKEQLGKASAILAVIDYTQRGNDADKELRDFLDGVIEEKADRFYVVVNKFDQKGANDSKDTNKLRIQIASQSFQGKVKAEQVFPVSSQNAYYANAALRELDGPQGTLPLTEEWVKQFGNLAFGEMAAEMLPDAERVRKGATKLLEKSLFHELTKPVIQDGYRRAAFMSMYSAIDLVTQQSKAISDFLGFRNNSIGLETAALKKLVAGLEDDVTAVKHAAIALRSQAETARSALQKKAKAIYGQTGVNVKSTLDNFFKTGQSITQATNQKLIEARVGESKKLEKEEALPGAGHFWGSILNSNSKSKTSKLQENQLFDPNDTKVVFDKESEADKFSHNIKKEITRIVETLGPKIEAEFKDALQTLSNDMRLEVSERYLKPIAAKAETGIKESLGFSLKINLSNVPLPISEALNLDEIGGEMIDKQTKMDPRRRLVDQDGFIGGTKRWFGKAVGLFSDNEIGQKWESYTVELEHYIVDISKIRDSVLGEIQTAFTNLNTVMKSHIDAVVMPEINTALEKLSDDLEGYRGNLLQSIQDKNKSQESQLKIKQRLEQLAKRQEKVHFDTLDTQKELAAIEIQQSTQLA